MNGILNVYKEKGPTSHDVVDDIRRILHVKKCGHAGTLDPEAEGVLPVCIGKATRFSSMLSDEGKTYRAVMLLGTVTDTQDATGTVISRKAVDVSEDEAKAAVKSFEGTYDQIPPMYSARKVQGRKLYELARAGEEVERNPKRVVIDSIHIDDCDLPRVTFTVSCSKGTYIRTLCHDIGRKLGCGACMESLVRTRVGRFTAEDAITPARVKELQESGLLNTALTSVDELFSDCTSLTAIAGTPGDKLLHNGNPVSERYVKAADTAGNITGKVRMYDSRGEFTGVYGYNAAKAMYVPVKVFI